MPQSCEAAQAVNALIQVIMMKIFRRSFLGNLFLLFSLITLLAGASQWPSRNEVHTKSGSFAGAEYEYTGKSYIFYIFLSDGTSFYISTDWDVFDYQDYEEFLSSKSSDPSVLTIRYISVERAGAMKAVGLRDQNRVYLDEAAGLKDHREGHIIYTAVSVGFFLGSGICYCFSYRELTKHKAGKNRRKQTKK